MAGMKQQNLRSYRFYQQMCQRRRPICRKGGSRTASDPQPAWEQLPSAQSWHLVTRYASCEARELVLIYLNQRVCPYTYNMYTHFVPPDSVLSFGFSLSLQYCALQFCLFVGLVSPQVPSSISSISTIKPSCMTYSQLRQLIPSLVPSVWFHPLHPPWLLPSLETLLVHIRGKQLIDQVWPPVW